MMPLLIVSDILKSGISNVASHNYAKIEIESDDDSPLEKTLSLQDVAILI